MKLINIVQIPNGIKLNLKMRLTILFMVISLFQMNAENSYSQNVKITINLNNVDVSTVLNEIENLTDFSIYYRDSQIDLTRKVSINVKKKKIKNILEFLFSNTNVDYQLIDNNIILTDHDKSKITPKTYGVQPVSNVQQQQTITGTITDSFGSPLPGVSILKVGTVIGTESDFDGNFSIEAANGESLTISYLGMKTQTIIIGDETTLTIVMEDDASALDEVIVTGYGTQKKATLTGAVANVTGDVLEKSSSPNLGTALSGKVAGLLVDTGSNTPGLDSPGIRIRGTNTFNNSSALVVIDGIPDRAGGLSRINPADIESISVLKDASAAIYGARAANGVIIVTTKKGKKGPATVKINSNFGVQNFTTVPEMLRGEEYMDLINVLNVYKLPTNEWDAGFAAKGEIFIRPNGDPYLPSFTNERIANTALGEDLWNYPNTDWMEEVGEDNAPIMRQNIQITGGGDNITYFTSMGFLRQDVNFKNAPKGFTQYDLRLNLGATINEHLKLDVGLYSRQEENLTSTRSSNGVISDLIRQYPWFPAYWPTGEFGPDIENGNNPAIRVTEDPGYTKRHYNFVQSNMALTFKVPGVEGLQFVGNVSYDKMNFDYKNWEKPWTLYTWDGENKDSSGLTAATRGPLQASLTNEHTTRTDITASINGSYERQYGDHFFKGFVGITREEVEQDWIHGYREQFLTTELDQLSFGGNENKNSRGDAFTTARLNYYGRVNYNYKEKYLLELLFRYDGSYLFPDENRYGFFPGISAGWVLSEESFFESLLPIFQFAKLRASWGELGNDNVAPYQYLATYGLSQTGLDDVVTTTYETKVPNPNITWETAVLTNFGLDLQMIDNRLSFTLDVFKQVREDILTRPLQTLPEYSGITPPAQNIGEFENTGFEISTSFRGETDGGLGYNFTLNFTNTNNKIIFFDEPELADRPWQRQTGGEIGRPLYYRYDGVFRSQAEIDAAILDYSGVTPGLKPGDARVLDISGDGKIGPEDKTRVGGSVQADMQFGFNTSLTYKNFDFSMFWNGGAGGWNNYEWSFMSGTLANVQREVRDRAWAIDKTDAKFPRLADRGDQWYSGQTDAFLMTRDFIRLKSLEIGYNFQDNVNRHIGAKSMRLSLVGTNLLTFTDFPFDPESSQVSNNDLSNNGINRGGSTLGVSGGALNNGQAYPSLKTVSLGLQITF